MIRYHGLPMTPIDTMINALAGKNVMVSYANPEQIEVACQKCSSVALDCGTFSAWRAGEEYNPEGYLEFATLWLRHPCVVWATIPDIIDGSELENDELLKAWPHDKALSVPVYHLHEDLSRLERLIEQYPRIGFGSSGVFKDPNTPIWWDRMAEMMKVACDAEGYPKRKYHGFRMLDTGIFSRIPLASADSTNVARNIGFDTRWRGPYVPKSKTARALVLISNIENHIAADRWNFDEDGLQNFELLG